jgi:hypothetical protein
MDGSPDIWGEADQGPRVSSVAKPHTRTNASGSVRVVEPLGHWPETAFGDTDLNPESPDVRFRGWPAASAGTRTELSADNPRYESVVSGRGGRPAGTGVQLTVPRLRWFDREPADQATPVPWTHAAVVTATVFLNIPFWIDRGSILCGFPARFSEMRHLPRPQPC